VLFQVDIPAGVKKLSEKNLIGNVRKMLHL